MTDRIPVQVRLDPDLHADVARVARKLRISRNDAYTILLRLGIEALKQAEITYHPPVVAVANA